MQPDPMNNQPGGTAPQQPPIPNGQMPYQPYPQPAPKPPKPPMDPAKKKKIIIGVSVGVGVAILAIVAIIVISIVTKIDYSTAFQAAKEVKSELTELTQDYSCKSVVNQVSNSTDMSDYKGYVERCLNSFNGINESVNKLAEADAIKKDNDLKSLFESFKSELDSKNVDSAQLKEKLDIYIAFHGFYVTSNDYDTRKWDAAKKDLEIAAEYYINSGNETLKTYGEKWLELRVAAAEAYKTYWDASYSDPQKSEYRTAMNTAQDTYNDFVSDNKPNITKLAPIDLPDYAEVERKFENLGKSISTKYQQNYKFGSNDCSENQAVGYASCSL